MTTQDEDSQRAEAYATFARRINDLAIAQLHEGEADILREAADARVFDSGKELDDHMALADQLISQLAKRPSFSKESADTLRQMLYAIPADQLTAV